MKLIQGSNAYVGTYDDSPLLRVLDEYAAPPWLRTCGLQFVESGE
jgi:hypothetical protein